MMRIVPATSLNHGANPPAFAYEPLMHNVKNARNSPRQKIITARRNACRNNPPRLSPRSNRFAVDSGTATPTIHRKNGKIRSVNVHPFHSAWSSCSYTWSHDPGLFTSIIAAIVAPRNTSSDISRPLPAADLAGVDLVVACNADRLRTTAL